MIVVVFKWNKAEVPIQGKWLPYKASLVQNVWSRCDTCPSPNSASAGNNSRAHSKKAVKQFGRPLRQLGAMINISPNFCNPSSSYINPIGCTIHQNSSSMLYSNSYIWCVLRTLTVWCCKDKHFRRAVIWMQKQSLGVQLLDRLSCDHHLT